MLLISLVCICQLKNIVKIRMRQHRTLAIFPVQMDIYLLKLRPSSANMNVGNFDNVIFEYNIGKYDI